MTEVRISSASCGRFRSWALRYEPYECRSASLGHPASPKINFPSLPVSRSSAGFLQQQGPAIPFSIPAHRSQARRQSEIGITFAIVLETSLGTRITLKRQTLVAGIEYSGHAWFHLPSDAAVNSLKAINKPLGLDASLLGHPAHPCRLPGHRHHKSGQRSTVLWHPSQVIPQLLPEIGPLLEQCLLLANTLPQFHADEDSCYFAELFARVTSRVAIQRRNGIPLITEFGTPESAFKFQEQNIRFIAACDAAPNHVGSSVRGLPQSLAWTFLILREHMHGSGIPDDDQIIAAVFAAAQNLLRRHSDQLDELLEAARCEEIRHRMRAIARKVEEKGIVSFSHLVRSFDQQKTSLYRPLVDVLVEAEVIDHHPDGRLALGSRRFEDVATSLSLASLPH